MADTPHVIDATVEGFQTQVVERSHQLPVVVDFWADWCGPCKMLMPVLTQLAESYGGKFLLAKVNIDQQQELAMQYGVRSVPTVKVFRFGAVVDEFMGVQPEGQIRAVIDRYIERESDRVINEASERFAQGETDAGIEMIRRVLADEPENQRAQLALTEMLVSSGKFAEARRILDELPVDQRMEDGVQALLARLEFAEAAADAPSAEALEQALADNPGDSEARYRLGARCLLDGDYERALESFLELMRRDRKYGDDAGRKAMVRIFELLGSDSELVGRYRRQMARLLY